MYHPVSRSAGYANIVRRAVANGRRDPHVLRLRIALQWPVAFTEAVVVFLEGSIMKHSTAVGGVEPIHQPMARSDHHQHCRITRDDFDILIHVRPGRCTISPSDGTWTRLGSIFGIAETGPVYLSAGCATATDLNMTRPQLLHQHAPDKLVPEVQGNKPVKVPYPSGMLSMPGCTFC